MLLIENSFIWRYLLTKSKHLWKYLLFASEFMKLIFFVEHCLWSFIINEVGVNSFNGVPFD